MTSATFVPWGARRRARQDLSALLPEASRALGGISWWRSSPVSGKEYFPQVGAAGVAASAGVPRRARLLGRERITFLFLLLRPSVALLEFMWTAWSMAIWVQCPISRCSISDVGSKAAACRTSSWRSLFSASRAASRAKPTCSSSRSPRPESFSPCARKRSCTARSAGCPRSPRCRQPPPSRVPGCGTSSAPPGTSTLKLTFGPDAWQRMIARLQDPQAIALIGELYLFSMARAHLLHLRGRGNLAVPARADRHASGRAAGACTGAPSISAASCSSI